MEIRNELSYNAEQEPTRFAQAVAVGSRLRAVRHQIGLSLLAVEQLSHGEFREAALGSYERGERAITLARLQRLAKIYNVSVAQMLLPEDVNRLGWEENENTGASPSFSRPTHLILRQKATIDLTKLRAGTSPEYEVLRRFTMTVQVLRQDFNGRVITIRGEDVRKLACSFGMTPDAMGRRLGDLGVLVESTSEIKP